MTSDGTLLFLRIAAVTTALLGTVQTVLGLMILSNAEHSTHGMIGNITFVVALVAAIAAYLWQRRSGNTGLLMHAAGMAVLALVQIGLGEMHLRTLHITVGVLFFVGAVALATLAIGKPGARLEQGTASIEGR